MRRHLDAVRANDPTADDLATCERQRGKFVAVIAAMEDAESAGPIASELDRIGKALKANARTRQQILARHSAWQRGQDQINDVLAAWRTS